MILQVCIYLTFGCESVMSAHIVPEGSPHCPVQTETATQEFCHVVIQRSTDLVHWDNFVEGDFPSYAVFSVEETINRPTSYYRIL